MYIVEISSSLYSEYARYENELTAKEDARKWAALGYTVTLYKAVSEFKKSKPPVEEVPV